MAGWSIVMAVSARRFSWGNSLTNSSPLRCLTLIASFATLKAATDKKISLLACVLIVGFTFILFFAQNDAMILVGEGLLNIPMSFINNVAREYSDFNESPFELTLFWQRLTPSRWLHCPFDRTGQSLSTCSGFSVTYSVLELCVTRF